MILGYRIDTHKMQKSFFPFLRSRQRRQKPWKRKLIVKKCKSNLQINCNKIDRVPPNNNNNNNNNNNDDVKYMK